VINTFGILTNQDFYTFLVDVKNEKDSNVLAGVPYFPLLAHPSRSCSPLFFLPLPVLTPATQASGAIETVIGPELDSLSCQINFCNAL